MSWNTLPPGSTVRPEQALGNGFNVAPWILMTCLQSANFFNKASFLNTPSCVR
jgi:hypothetical protein